MADETPCRIEPARLEETSEAMADVIPFRMAMAASAG
jgi:hypothetical protein